MLNNKVIKKLNDYLDNECDDYGMSYSWEYNPDIESFEVSIKRDTDYSGELRFKYEPVADDLAIETAEDVYEITRHYDHTVKYFWMMLAPQVFPT